MPAVMEVVDRFPYLGDMVARDGSDTHAVNGRIEAGSKAFGALRGCIFSSTSINRQAKQAVYEAIVLSITLYGSECWSLTETLRQRLRVMQGHHFRDNVDQSVNPDFRSLQCVHKRPAFSNRGNYSGVRAQLLWHPRAMYVPKHIQIQCKNFALP